jgi:hypothetical protein
VAVRKLQPSVPTTTQVLAGIRNSVIALARRAGWTNIAAALRRYSIKTAKALELLGIRYN